MASSKSSQSKAAWDRARKYAREHGVTVREARSILAREKAEPKKPQPASKSQPQQASKSKSQTIDLAAAEAALRKKYPHIVAGSIQAHDDGPHQGRRTVEIICQNKGCQNTRRIHTSDAFQVELCPECTKTARQQRRAKTAKKGSK
jgi:hypothetical protein